MARFKKPKSSSAKKKPPKPPPDAGTWPLLQAYAPWRDCWSATACGGACVLRRAPDGRVAAAVFAIELIHGGLQYAGSYLLEPDETPESYLARLKGVLPPMALSSPEDAANFAWAARAFSEREGACTDHFDFEFSMLPEPRKTPEALVSWLLHGATPDRLSDICQRNFEPGLPTGQEAMCLTTMTFAVPDLDAAIAALRSAEPDFSEDEQKAFVWTREYPKGHWSGMAGSGHRQVIGSIGLRGGQLVAEVNTLTWGWVLALKLRDMVPEVRIVGADWKDTAAAAGESKKR
ncbi:MAG: hypothetical protein HY901_16845 [Deltaproteobacteria bacterium]|nr:hypothetical protein [Deltaproteobacteria bacterium]